MGQTAIEQCLFQNPVVAIKAVRYNSTERNARGLRALDQVQRDLWFGMKRHIVLATGQSRGRRVRRYVQRVVMRLISPQGSVALAVVPPARLC